MNHELLIIFRKLLQFIEELIDKGYAYQAGNDVYFRIETFPDYGKLSKQKIEDLHAGVRIDVCDQKENPLRFCIMEG